jgi:hypothetical protein
MPPLQVRNALRHAFPQRIAAAETTAFLLLAAGSFGQP